VPCTTVRLRHVQFLSPMGRANTKELVLSKLLRNIPRQEHSFSNSLGGLSCENDMRRVRTKVSVLP